MTARAPTSRRAAERNPHALKSLKTQDSLESQPRTGATSRAAPGRARPPMAADDHRAVEPATGLRADLEVPATSMIGAIIADIITRISPVPSVSPARCRSATTQIIAVATIGMS
jgi:hypothetical protein